MSKSEFTVEIKQSESLTFASALIMGKYFKGAQATRILRITQISLARVSTAGMTSLALTRSYSYWGTQPPPTSRVLSCPRSATNQ
jgi:hypothetical protein